MQLSSGQKRDVVVVGSANLDLVVAVQVLPRPGETVLAYDVREGVGGKGLNQAVAASRVGARTAFIGAVGDDEAGGRIRRVLIEDGVDVAGLAQTTGASGRAVVLVEAGGENSILVVPGANSSVHSLAPAQLQQVRNSAVLLLQLEIPAAGVVAAARAALEGGVRVILNAAPAVSVPPEVLELVDVLVVNQHEAQALLGGDPGVGKAAADVVLSSLLELAPAAVLTLGAAGSAFADRSTGVPRLHHPPRVRSVDTTGAGDTFTGVLAGRLARGDDLAAGVQVATAAAALSVTRPGAVAAIPAWDEVQQLLAADQSRAATPTRNDAKDPR